jgi:hypothetical protein
MINSLALAYLGTTTGKERQKTILEEAAESGKAAPASGAPPPASAPAQAPASAPGTAPVSPPAPTPAPK